MYVIDTYVGNRSEDDASARLAAGSYETVTVGDHERRRSRFRTETEEGSDVGVVVGRELRAGDVLEGDGLTVVVELEDVEALVIDCASSEDVLAAVELGHAAGNRHWDMAVRDGSVLFPVTESRERMESTVEPYLPAGAALSSESVPPSTFDGRGPTHTHGEGEDGGNHDHAAGTAGDRE